MRTLCKTFRSVKSPNPNPSSSKSDSPSWSVYLILSTNPPIKTYVGVTTNFTRRLKQHNGELKGGAKASRAGRPWICACIICGFADRSEACMFESKWKSLSRRAPSKKNENENLWKHSEGPSVPLLRRRQAALNRVKGSLHCTHLEINWHL
ncbi:unnamed protein product [Lupinus luteus]|uniref:GIY-YIG domain-containing protein n=1 Tax=Lupinus luteus TaxID=3873 RepID=A0AAV1W520_LUPLU